MVAGRRYNDKTLANSTYRPFNIDFQHSHSSVLHCISDRWHLYYVGQLIHRSTFLKLLQCNLLVFKLSPLLNGQSLGEPKSFDYPMLAWSLAHQGLCEGNISSDTALNTASKRNQHVQLGIEQPEGGGTFSQSSPWLELLLISVSWDDYSLSRKPWPCHFFFDPKVGGCSVTNNSQNGWLPIQASVAWAIWTINCLETHMIVQIVA